MRPLYYRFRRTGRRSWHGDTALDAAAGAARGRRPQPVREGRLLPSRTEDDRRPSARMLAAAACLRGGEVDVHRIEALTGVPAALVDLMKETTAAEVIRSPAGSGPRNRREDVSVRWGMQKALLMTAALLSAVGIVGSAAAIGTGRLWAGQLGGVVAVLALLGCRRAARSRRAR